MGKRESNPATSCLPTTRKVARPVNTKRLTQARGESLGASIACRASSQRAARILGVSFATDKARRYYQLPSKGTQINSKSLLRLCLRVSGNRQPAPKLLCAIVAHTLSVASLAISNDKSAPLLDEKK